jgi:dTDP-4-dehydrorhamnose reductase
MKILLFGKNGQLGWELQRSLAPLGHLVALGRSEADFSNADALQATVLRHQPDVIVNAAAYTAVDRAEKEEALARRINTEAVQALAMAAKAGGARLIHYSTDYVFDGTKASPYREEDSPHPLNVYGRTKLGGDQAIQSSGCAFLIFRTSWVFATHGANFIKTMLRLAQERNTLQVVADQVGAPTSAELIADVTALCLYRLMIDRALATTANGIYHLAADGSVSWYDYARYLLQQAESMGAALQTTAERIEPIPSERYPLPAQRPHHSILDTGRLRSTFGIHLPPWQTHVDRMLTETLERGH